MDAIPSPTKHEKPNACRTLAPVSPVPSDVAGALDGTDCVATEPAGLATSQEELRFDLNGAFKSTHSFAWASRVLYVLAPGSHIFSVYTFCHQNFGILPLTLRAG